MAVSPTLRPDRTGPLPAAQGDPAYGTLANPGGATTFASSAAPSNPTVPYTPGSQYFTTGAATPTPYAAFTAPNPAAVSSDPYYQFRTAEGEKAIQRSAASHGTLLNGGTLKALEQYRQGVASEEAGKAFDRALAAYNTNRETNAQNYGQQNQEFAGNLNAFGENVNAELGRARLAPPPATDPHLARSSIEEMSSVPAMGTLSGLDEYARSVAAARQPTAFASPAPSPRRPYGFLPTASFIAAPGVQPRA